MKSRKQFGMLLVGAGFAASAAWAQSTGAVGTWGSVDASAADGVPGVPSPAAARSGVMAIAAGWGHTVALKTNGTIVWWREGDQDETPPPIAAQTGVKAIAAGSGQTAVLKTNGAVVVWGYITYPPQTPMPPEAQSGVTAIAVGDSHTVALKNGAVIAWGYNDQGQTTVPAAAQSGVTAIAAGRYHTVALKNDGSVIAWGYSGFGQTTVPAAARSGVTAIAAGDVFTLALKSDGSVLAWGWEGLNQATVPLAAQSGVTAIAGGTFHAAALKNDGSVVVWNSHGLMKVPAGLSGVLAIAAGRERTVALVTPTAPAITAQPVSQAVLAGQSVSFTVAGTGFPFTCQWRKNGVDLPRQTTGSGTNTVELPMSPVYNLRLAQAGDAGSYTVVLSNSAGSVTSAPALLIVEPVALHSTFDVRPSGKELVLSWPIDAAGFTVQSTDDLVTWIDLTNPPAIVGGSFTVTNTPSSNARFYRLRKR